MGIKYLWDTNTAIYYLQQQFPPGAEAFIDKIIAKERPVISAITEIELLCWRAATEKDTATIQSFINDSLVIELEQPVKQKTAELRKTTKLKLPDAIIAATAIVHDLTLLSRNIADFTGTDFLQVVNPWNK
jgi:predicted nucleic acid-binding protein